jgi:uncharacterized SAM-binding protein YcdF (DUF218 family)
MNRTSAGEPFKTAARSRIAVHAICLMGAGMLATAAAGVVNGRTMVEKILTELVCPLGLVWLFLFAIVYFSLLMRLTWPAISTGLCWLLLTVAGNSLVANWLIRNLEAPYVGCNPFELEKLDTIVVLGGGTSYRDGRSQFGEGGDRVGLAARLYHAGQTNQVICTGSLTFQGSESELQVREQAAELLRSLLVPSEKIVLVEGVNTSQEMVNLKRYLDSVQPKPARIGLITSGYHLSRAMRLAQKNGLALIPIAADLKGDRYRTGMNLIIPSDGGLRATKIAIKEYLAGFVGR